MYPPQIQASVRAVMARLFAALSAGMDREAIDRFGMYGLVYGASSLGKIGPQQKPMQQVNSRPGPGRSR